MSEPRSVLGLSQEAVHALVLQWQKNLRLSDWELETEIADPRDMDGSDASVIPCDERRKAVIRIAADTESMEDLHDSVIHELLHLHLWFVEAGTVYMKLTEHAIHAIAPLMARFYLAAASTAP